MQLNQQPIERIDHDGEHRREVSVHSIWLTIQGEGPFAGQPAVFVRLAGCNLQCPACFHGNTVIRMADYSTRLISEIKAGDRVLSYSLKRKRFVSRSVTAVMSHQVKSLFKVVAGIKKTYVTGDHPFLVRGRGWVPARELKKGDKILHLSLSELRRLHNPMKDAATVLRMKESMEEGGGWTSPWEKMSEVQRRRLRKRLSHRMKKNNPMKNPEVALRGFLNRKDRGRMTSVERLVARLGKPFGLRFVGGGDLVVGCKVPDFVVEGTNKLVEVWAASQTEYLGRDDMWMENRRKVFEAEGFEVLFVPVPDGIGKKKQLQLVKQLSEYARNGCEIRSVEKISQSQNKKVWARLAGTTRSPLTVYNLEVQGTHTYIADRMIVHNCDTEYTSKAQRLSAIAVYRKVQEVAGQLPRWKDSQGMGALVVITGGEPFRQTGLISLCRALWHGAIRVQIETNGTLPPVGWQEFDSHITVVCSPKTGVIHPKLRPVISAYKYVVEAGNIDEQDGLPITTLGNTYRVARPHAGFSGPVYVQPLDMQDPEKNKQNVQAAVDSCMKFGYTFCYQVHKAIGLA